MLSLRVGSLYLTLSRGRYQPTQPGVVRQPTGQPMKIGERVLLHRHPAGARDSVRRHSEPGEHHGEAKGEERWVGEGKVSVCVFYDRILHL